MQLSVSENKHEKDTAGTGAMLLFSGVLALRILPPFCLQSQYKLYYNMFPCVKLFSFGVCGHRAKKEGGQCGRSARRRRRGAVAEHKREGGVSLWSLDIEISIIFIQSPLVSQRKIIFIVGDEGEERRRRAVAEGG